MCDSRWKKSSFVSNQRRKNKFNSSLVHTHDRKTELFRVEAVKQIILVSGYKLLFLNKRIFMKFFYIKIK